MILFKLHVDLPNLNCRLHIISLYFLCSWFLLTLGQDKFFCPKIKVNHEKKIFWSPKICLKILNTIFRQKILQQKFDFCPSVYCPTLVCWMICWYNSNCSTSNSNHHSTRTRKMVQTFGSMDNNKNHNNRPDRHRTSSSMIFS